MTRPGDAPRAYVDAPITDRDAAIRAASRAATTWGLDEPVLMRIGMNAIFAAGTNVLRVSSPSVAADASLALLDVLAAQGLSVPVASHDDVIVSDGLSVTCWERLEATKAAVDWRSVGAMVRRVHELDPGVLPSSVPLPSPSVFPWWNFDALLELTAPALDLAARRGLEATIEQHRNWQAFTNHVVCHGDVHPGNVMMTAEGPVLIDWDLLCWAPVGWDHAPMLTWAQRWTRTPGLSVGEYDAFADGYGESLAADPATRAFADLRLVAATLMRLAAGMSNPAAMPEAQLRLRYWRGEPAAPMWTAQ